MDKFIVSARKYRPQTFDTVVGQSHITTTLKNAIRNNQLAHAFLFCGPRGVGKTTCARILAKTINCENQQDGEACNTCSSCKSFNEGGSLNYFELDAASNNSVDNIRDLVDQVRFVPQSGKYKVYVIDEVHMLSTSAFNAFLKTLEEPPPYAIFILATTEKHKILPTILSRCQIFDFKRITLADTVEHLREICEKEEIKADKASLQVIAQKSEGCMRDALSILDKIVSFTNGELTYTNTLEHLNILDAAYYFRFLEYMKEQDLSSALLLFDEINRKGFEGDIVLNGFAEFLRNLLVSKDANAAVLLEAVEGFRDKYIATASETNPALLISALNIINEAELNYKAARNKRLHVELMIIKLCYLQQAIELSNDSNGLGKKKIIDSAKALSFRNIQPIPGRQPATGTKPPSITRQEAKIFVEEVAVSEKSGPGNIKSPNEPAQPVSQATTSITEKPQTRISALDKIRKQYQTNGNTGSGQVHHALTIDQLQKSWDEYTQQLKEARHAAAQSFELATLRIKDDNCFEVITANNLEQKFIEQERNKVYQFLHVQLNNRLLQFNVIVEDKPGEKKKIEVSMTAREQLQKMIEQYPLVKELKDRLRLELDY